MKIINVAEIIRALPTVSDEDFDALRRALKQLQEAATKEARRRRGRQGVGVLGAKGQNFQF